jgi:hypothetical protein
VLFLSPDKWNNARAERLKIALCRAERYENTIWVFLAKELVVEVERSTMCQDDPSIGGEGWANNLYCLC